MMRSLFAGVSGLRNHQVRMDVIGNNIANVNTVAFKSGRVTFKEGFAQLLQGASRPPGDLGGTNPIQVGLGMQIGSVDMMFSQGNLETTGLATDVAIQGDSFFVVKKGTQNYYTRSGNFQLDSLGQLVSPTNGFVVQGKMAENGVFLPGVQNITLPVGQKTAAKATDTTTLAGNLDAAAPIFTGTFDATGRADPLNVDSWTESSITVFDSLGNQHDLKIQFWKTAADTWSWQLDGTNLPAGFTPPNSTPQTLTFDTAGLLTTAAPTSPPVITFTPSGAAAVSVTLELGIGTVNGITSFAGTNNAVLKDQNGYEAGQLQNFTIDRTGIITGSFTNGTNVVLAQIVLADFNNPGGLLRVGDNMYSVSGNSGGPVLGYSLQGVQSTISSGALEMSNVDLAQEFTNMIVTQRGFQANSRVITSSDEMLQELVNLKR
ncbi:MAG: flagellar hook protein FlgE [Gemmatimonadaceae bacterium]|nr:flagellar hook protein FlgE [Gemmatimonadaceae bacterium]